MTYSEKVLLDAKDVERSAATKDYNRIVDLRILGFAGLLLFSVSGVQHLTSHNVSFKYLILESTAPIPPEYQFHQQALNSTSVVELSLKSKDITIQITGQAQLASHTSTPIQKLSQSILEAYGQEEGAITPPILFEVSAVTSFSVSSLPDNVEETKELVARYTNENGETDTCIFHVKTHYQRLDSLIASRRVDLQRLQKEHTALQLNLNESLRIALLNKDANKNTKYNSNNNKNKKKRTASSGSLSSNHSSASLSRNTSFDQSALQPDINTNNNNNNNLSIFQYGVNIFQYMRAFCWNSAVRLSRTICNIPNRIIGAVTWSYSYTVKHVVPQRAYVMFFGSALLIHTYGHLVVV